MTIQTTLNHLYNEAKQDSLRISKGLVKKSFDQMEPMDFSELYLSITKEQGAYLKELIIEHQFKNIIEFGTSFGISTLFIAEAILETKGHIITTELIESKAQKAIQNFKKAGISHLVEVRIGNAIETLKNHNSPIDLLLLDGWKDLYLPLFLMLEPNFHAQTVIYVDNADMEEVDAFLKIIGQNPKYQIESTNKGKVAIIKGSTTF